MRILKARFRSGDEFIEHYLPTLPGGGLFYPTREQIPVGTDLLVEVRFPSSPIAR